MESDWRWFPGHSQLQWSLPQIIFWAPQFTGSLPTRIKLPQLFPFASCIRFCYHLPYSSLFSFMVKIILIVEVYSLESYGPSRVTSFGFVSASSSVFFCLYLFNALIIQGLVISSISDVLKSLHSLKASPLVHALDENIFIVYLEYTTFSLSLITCLTVFSP